MMKLLLLLTLLGGVASAEPLKTSESTKDLADKIMATIGKKDYEAGFNLAKEHWPIEQREIDRVAELTQSQLDSVAPRFGKIVGVEYLGKAQLGDAYIKYTYLFKMERHSLVWNVVFYKPEDTWLVNAINWNDKPEELFPEFGVVEKAKK